MFGILQAVYVAMVVDDACPRLRIVMRDKASDPNVLIVEGKVGGGTRKPAAYSRTASQKFLCCFGLKRYLIDSSFSFVPS
jgi:hypothetical protein